MYLQNLLKAPRVGYFIILALSLTILSCGEEPPAQRSTDAEPSATTESRPASGNAGWPMFMRDILYQGISPDTSLKPPLALMWKFKTGGPVISSPVVVDGTVYVGSDDHKLYALQARKWGVKWEFEAGDRILYAPTVREGTVYFSARDNKVYALDAATGAKKWEFQADGWINAPVVVFNQKIYFGCYENKIYTLNAATGKEEALELASIGIGRTRFICSDGEFYPMDARYQASRWRKELPPSVSWPARANGVVYIGARDGRLHAFDYVTRAEVWHFETDGWVDSSPAIAGGMLYIGSQDGYIYAFGNATDPPQEVDSTDGEVGVVTRDGVRIYDRLDEQAKVIARLNEGRSLPIVDSKEAVWRQVILPDGRDGWVSVTDFIAIRWVSDLQVNSPLVKDVTPLSLPSKAEEPSWSPDGTLAFFDNISIQSIYWRAKSLWLANSDGSNAAWVADGSFYNPNISWSRNGEWIALENLAGTDREVWVVRANGTGLRKTADGEAPAISPRGGKVAFIFRDEAASTIWMRGLKEGGQQKLAEIPLPEEESRSRYNYVPILDPPAWSPGGSRLAAGMDGYHYSDGNSRVVVVDASGGVVREMAVRAERIRDIVWSPDGDHLAYITQGHPSKPVTKMLDKQIHLTNLKTPGRERVFEHCEGITWSPDGKYMAFIAENDCMGMKKKVWLLDVDSQQLTQLLATREKIYKIFWLTDQRIGLLASVVPSETGPRARGWIISIAAL
ncbi:PQQ-binding-like beta-propeller repeat protein [Candidatus Poribacteria bacterium]